MSPGKKLNPINPHKLFKNIKVTVLKQCDCLVPVLKTKTLACYWETLEPLAGAGELIEDLWIISVRPHMGLWDPSFFHLPFFFLPGHKMSFALSSAPALCPAVPLPEVSTDVETSAGTSKSPNQKKWFLFIILLGIFK